MKFVDFTLYRLTKYLLTFCINCNPSNLFKGCYRCECLLIYQLLHKLPYIGKINKLFSIIKIININNLHKKIGIFYENPFYLILIRMFDSLLCYQYDLYLLMTKIRILRYLKYTKCLNIYIYRVLIFNALIFTKLHFFKFLYGLC